MRRRIPRAARRLHVGVVRAIVVAFCLLWSASLARADVVYAGRNGDNRDRTIVAIDPETGNEVVVARVPDIYSSSTFDLFNGRLFFFAYTADLRKELVTVDVVKGTATHTVLSNSRCYPLVEFDPVTQRLYGMLDDSLVAIDPATGLVTPLVSAPQPSIALTSAFDVTGRRFFYLSVFDQTLVSIDVDKTVVTQTTLLPVDHSFVEFDPLTGKVYMQRTIIRNGGEDHDIVAVDPLSGREDVIVQETPLGRPTTFDVAGRRLFYHGCKDIPSPCQDVLTVVQVDTKTMTKLPLTKAISYEFVEFWSSPRASAAVPMFARGWLLVLIIVAAAIALRQLGTA